jgi:nucleoside-diphosphate-sugar epimerase
MNCLVIGGAGFIGSYVVQNLLAAGHHPVIFDFITDKNALQKVCGPDEIENVDLVYGDVADLASLARAVKEYKIDSMVHLAAWQIPGCNNNPTKAITINGIGFNNTLEVAALYDVKRLVWASSNAVFGSPADHHVDLLPNDEYHKPNTVYGALKTLNEYMAGHFYQTRGVDSIGLRFGLVYGFGRMRGASTFASAMIEKSALGEPCDVDNGDAIVDWFYAVDAGQLVMAALQAPQTAARSYNVSGDLRGVKEAADFLTANIPGTQLTIKPGTINANWNLDSTLLKEEIGFEHRYSMEEGIRDAVARVRQSYNLPPLDGFDPVELY